MSSSLSEELKTLRSAHRYRTLKTLSNPQGPRVIHEGRELLNFCSNDYLGLAHHPELIAAAQAAAAKWGTGSGASRLVSGSLAIHEELERAIAAFKHETSALTFASGFQTNLGVISAIVGAGDSVYVDRLCHASLIDGARLSGAKFKVYPHNDAERLADLLSKDGADKKLVVTDSYFSMDGDVAPLDKIFAACKNNSAMLLVDEAHAVAVAGQGGRGYVERFSLEGKIDFVVGTFSKAFGSQGGFVCASEENKNYLINKSRTFIYSTAPSPITTAVSLAAIQLVKRQPELRKKLWDNVTYLRSRLTQMGHDLMGSEGPIIPILIGDSERVMTLSKQLFDKGIYVTGIRPPTVPNGTDRLRITVTSAHSEADLDNLVSTLSSPQFLSSPRKRGSGSKT